ncbi:SipW-dependent-type signal peptide-containing protein [Paraglaciecola sp. MB-3u-78]
MAAVKALGVLTGSETTAFFSDSVSSENRCTCL